MLKLELKRILKTRLTAILLLIALTLSFLMAYMPVTFRYVTYLGEDGKRVELFDREAIAYTKEVQAGIAGEVTSEMVQNALEDYQAVLRKYGVQETYDLPEGVYDDEILAYAPLVHGIKEAFADPETGVAPSLMEIDPEQIGDYYGALESHIRAIGKMEQKKHPAAQAALAGLYAKVDKPYLFYPGYHTDAMDYQVLLAFLILGICAVIAAPVFTSDYQTGADDILRCTRHGKTKLALTKVLSAMLISGSAFALSAAIYIVVSNSLFGWDSTQMSMQILYSITNLLNVDIVGLQLFTALGGLLSLLAAVSLILFLSARCKNMVVSLSAALVCCILPMILYAALPYGISEWAYSLFPASGAGIQTSILYAAAEYFFLNIGDLALWQPYVMLGACIVEIPLFAALAVCGHVRREVG